FVVGLPAPGALPKVPILVLLRRIGIFHIAYIPHAPSLEHTIQSRLGPPHFLECLGKKLSSCVPEITFIRFDLNWDIRKCAGSELKQSHLKKSPVSIQPPDTVILPISAARFSEDDLLGRMKSKTRYNIRLAARKGVIVRRTERRHYEVPPELEAWYDLYKITEKRNRISLHSFAYYAHLFSLMKDEECRLYLARHDNDLLAGIIVIRYRKQGYYLYGASSDSKRNFMPAYALQWQAICDLRSEGVECYDFFGIPAQADVGHPMFGLHQFKTGFGGDIVHYPGTWDIPCKHILYFLYTVMERARAAVNGLIKKRSVFNLSRGK
ncbi:MAG: lipid II:glycine glycyltransferase FemX, partial [Salinispira sp.]